MSTLVPQALPASCHLVGLAFQEITARPGHSLSITARIQLAAWLSREMVQPFPQACTLMKLGSPENYLAGSPIELVDNQLRQLVTWLKFQNNLSLRPQHRIG